MGGFALNHNRPIVAQTGATVEKRKNHAVICAPSHMLEALQEAFKFRGIPADTFSTEGPLTTDEFHTALDKASHFLLYIGGNASWEVLMLRTQNIRAKNARVGFVCLSERVGHIERQISEKPVEFVAQWEHGFSPFPLGRTSHTMVETDPTAIVNAFVGKHV